MRGSITTGRSIAGFAAAALLALPAVAWAQAYPTKPITMIVPFAAGGPSDTLGRLTAEHLGRTLGQQVIVENVGGAGGTIGTERASRATPDGYTIFQHHGALTAAPALYANLKYDTRTAFEYIGLINTGPMVLTSRKTLETKTAKDLLAHVKQGNDKVTIAHAGVGSNSYMCALMIIQSTGAKPGLVPYRGTGPAMQDLVSGQVDVLCDQATTATPQIQAGTIKPYLVTSKQRLDALKDVPSYVEAGIADFEMTIWNGLYAPKGTPKAVLDRLHDALQKFIDDPKIVERFALTGTVPFGKDMRSPDVHKNHVEAELVRYAAMVKAAGVKAQEAK
jgi:tripartite-type tricarboxylate transporter receptor subunit TctC